ncbi:MAG TPA: TIGR00180 family glycosyltransferase [Xanthobacteraceae bacterium]|nr:TIGR00180 family glycosyltransferase [Xanthobacteraceae bacterium]
MAPLFIPTRNRPTSLSSVLRFLARYYGSTRVIVADGSEEGFKSHNRQNIEALKQDLAIDYRPYPAELPYFDRLLDVLRAESSEFVIMGSDDDYPMMDTLGEAEAFLLQNRDHCLAAGMLVSLKLESPTHMVTKPFLVRPITGDTPLTRARQFAQWPFQTTYAVTRRDVLIERYERARRLFMIGFYDYLIGIQDCMHGKIKALPEIGFIRTLNYKHSYLRPEAGLIFLRRSDQVLQILDQFRHDLMQYAGIEEHEAQAHSEHLIRQRLKELVGAPAHALKGFEERGFFLNPLVQKQFDIFDALFEKGTRVRAQYEEKLKYILVAMKASAQSDDNKGEKNINETLEGQLGDSLVAVGAPEE